MALRSTSPLDGSTLSVFKEWNGYKLRQALDEVEMGAMEWSGLDLAERAERIGGLAALLRSDSGELSRLISFEMGKLRSEALQEIENCALLCEHLAHAAGDYLGEERLVDREGHRVRLDHAPLGIVFAITPRYAPFWYALRVVLPSLLAGNGAVLKHAGAVTQCAMAIDDLLREGLGAPDAFRTLQITATQVPSVIAAPMVSAVSFCGSGRAGREVAEQAGAEGKKVTLHLGGSDPFVILSDADLERVVPAAFTARFTSAGQRAAAAKRFIVAESLANDFVERLRIPVESELIYGDPMNEATRFAPLASHELRDRLHRQVSGSRSQGAKVVTGCMPGEPPGAFYQASILDHLAPGMPAYEEELFGPVAAIIRVADDAEAIAVANHAPIGVGASVWSGDVDRALRVGHRLRCGQVYVNAPVGEDPAIPIGGVGPSGFGRLLGGPGCREFTGSRAMIFG
ncbi:MAG: aldehyde dehydrogenase family protein [Gammaproteobacteria bacterium]|nr:aldehyde dehydrogenase family protein [Gammaproteobacteria bacterium]